MKPFLSQLQRASKLGSGATQVLQKGEPEPRSPIIKALPLAALCLGYFMVVLDTTIVNVALPALQQQLGARVTELQWVVAGYLVVFGSLLLTGGVLGDRLGKKPLFLVGFVIFTLASVFCGVAPTIVMLQIARVVQGVGAALLVPSSLGLIHSTFPAPKARAKAIGIWGVSAALPDWQAPWLAGCWSRVSVGEASFSSMGQWEYSALA